MRTVVIKFINSTLRSFDVMRTIILPEGRHAQALPHGGAILGSSGAWAEEEGDGLLIAAMVRPVEWYKRWRTRPIATMGCEPLTLATPMLGMGLLSSWSFLVLTWLCSKRHSGSRVTT